MKINYNTLWTIVWPGVCSILFALYMKYMFGSHYSWVWDSYMVFVGFVYVMFMSIIFTTIRKE